MKFFEKSEGADETKRAAFPLLVLGVPLGCAFGIALRNLALGIGIGMLLAATVMVFRGKKDGRNFSPVMRVALVVTCVAVLAFVFFVKR
ncbi:MAG TPA: hypothetical protein VGM73_10890 [Candidatus Didemnitutus sp.]|jgi:hypothetical protein